VTPGGGAGGLDDPRGALLEALDSPEGLPPFAEWLGNAQTVALVLPDDPRPHAWPELPLVLVELLLEAGVEPSGLRVVLAPGAEAFSGRQGHPLEGLRERDVDWLVHDPRDASGLVPCGEVGRSGARSVAEGLLGEFVRLAGGQPPSPSRARASAGAGRRRTLELNRAVAGADRVILASSVAPHPLAGFTGAGHPLLPGVASTESIAAHEELGLLPTVGPGRTEGNPVREEADEAARTLGDAVLAVDVVAARGRGVAGFASGSPWLVARVTTPLALETFGVPCTPAPAVIASAAVDRLEDLVLAGAVAAPAVQTSGTMLLAGAVSRLGRAHRVRRLFETVLGPRLAGASLLVHTPLPAREVLRCGLRPVRSIAGGLEVMWERAGDDERMRVVPDALSTLPRV
jgi:nickel-dependent lactate racemase